MHACLERRDSPHSEGMAAFLRVTPRHDFLGLQAILFLFFMCQAIVVRGHARDWRMTPSASWSLLSELKGHTAAARSRRDDRHHQPACRPFSTVRIVTQRSWLLSLASTRRRQCARSPAQLSHHGSQCIQQSQYCMPAD